MLFILWLVYMSGVLRESRSFPTRRSSDLTSGESPGNLENATVYGIAWRGTFSLDSFGWRGARLRSEEHTSELQSQSNLVCRLLLEQKNARPPDTSERLPACTRCLLPRLYL